MSLQALHRSSNARRWFGVLALLAFGLKALVPTGYMYAAVHGHARLVMCPTGLYHTSASHHMAGMAHDSLMFHAAGVSHAGHGALTEQCPFALAGGAGLLAASPAAVEPYFVVLRPERVRTVPSAPLAPPPRYHAPRGPPSLA